MAKINLSLSAKVDNVTGKTSILFRFVGGRELIFRVKSGLSITPDRWNEKESKVIIPRLATKEQKELVRLQKQLDELCNIILEAFTTADKEKVSKEWLETIIDNYHFPNKQAEKEAEEKKINFFDVFLGFIETHKVSEVRKLHYKVTYRTLRRYELYKRKVSRKPFELSFESLTPDMLRDFDVFLRDEYLLCEKHPDIYEAVPESRTPQPRGQNTINGIFKKIRTFVLWAINNELITKDPFKKFTIDDSTYGTPYYITIDERKQIYACDMSDRPQLAIQRDIFVFQCLIGCRVGDLYKMTSNNIIGGAIEYIPRKTKEGRPVTVRVPLNDTAKEIIERYRTVEGASIFPFISEQKYNIAIKAIFKKAGVTRNVTVRNPTTGDAEIRPINEMASSHLARRCFVGNLYRQVKDPNLVGALSGHKEGSKAFARYREIDEDIKNELIKLLD